MSTYRAAGQPKSGLSSQELSPSVSELSTRTSCRPLILQPATPGCTCSRQGRVGKVSRLVPVAAAVQCNRGRHSYGSLRSIMGAYTDIQQLYS